MKYDTIMWEEQAEFISSLGGSSNIGTKPISYKLKLLKVA